MCYDAKNIQNIYLLLEETVHNHLEHLLQMWRYEIECDKNNVIKKFGKFQLLIQESA